MTRLWQKTTLDGLKAGRHTGMSQVWWAPQQAPAVQVHTTLNGSTLPHVCSVYKAACGWPHPNVCMMQKAFAPLGLWVPPENKILQEFLDFLDRQNMSCRTKVTHLLTECFQAWE